ncbi:hypothetical protein K8Z49_43040 [Actinomadura madurae]|uniref:hypothetical protein n=1 Tax=Actinomadura madurae TaxID=1993 RepID=UPI00399BC473
MKPHLTRIGHFMTLGPDTEDPALMDLVAPSPTTKPHVPHAMDDVVAVAPTGGTTGLPRG